MSPPPTPGLLSPEHVLSRVVEDLTARFDGIFAAETVHRYVFDTYTALGRTSKITAHLPVLTARFAADRLTALAQSTGVIVTGAPEVLFVCVHNAAQFPDGRGSAGQPRGGAVHVRSAGSTPIGELEPAVLAVMAEIGLPLTDAFPKPLTGRRRPRCRRGDHHGLRRRLPHLSRKALPGLASGRPGRAEHQHSPRYPRRPGPPRPRATSRHRSRHRWRPAMTDRPSVLFVCVKNGGKSQMAAGLMRAAAGDAVDVSSAGTAPGDKINALSAQSLLELGIDITDQRTRQLTDDMVAAADRVVVLGRDAHVESVGGTPVQVWDTDEPSERGIDGMERMRLVRDDIARRVDLLAAELLETS